MGSDPAAADLLRRVERAAAGGKLAVSAVDPAREPAEWVALLERVQRLTGGGPVVEAVRGAGAAGVEVAGGYEEVAALLGEAADGITAEAELPAAEKLRSDAATLLAQAAALRAGVKAAPDGLGEPLPDLARSRDAIAVLLREQIADRLPTMRTYLGRRAGDRSAPMAAQDAALRAVRVLEAAVGGLAPAATRLGETPVPTDQQRVRAALAGGRGVVVFHGDRVRAFAVEPDADPAALEERLAAALVTVTLSEPPALVFVDFPDAPAIERGGIFNLVAGRARDAGFEIGRLPLGPGPLTVQAFAPGRRVVWAVPPIATPDNQDDGPVSRLATLLKERLNAGDGVLWIPGFRRLGRYAQADPLAAVGAAAGVRVDEGELVLRLAAGEGDDAGRSPRRASRFRSDPRSAMPPTPRPASAPPWAPASPSSNCRSRSCWPPPRPRCSPSPTRASGSTPSRSPPATSRPPAPTPEIRGPQVVAAVAELPSAGRLAVFGDGLMFQDPVLQRARQSANADLFATTCLWLAGLDQAVLPGPSAGTGRVVPAVEPATRRNLQLASPAASRSSPPSPASPSRGGAGREVRGSERLDLRRVFEVRRQCCACPRRTRRHGGTERKPTTVNSSTSAALLRASDQRRGEPWSGIRRGSLHRSSASPWALQRMPLDVGGR